MIAGIPSVMTAHQRYAQMEAAIDTGLPFLKPIGQFCDERINIVCYGPSLLETWQEINHSYLPIMTVSGAHDFLLERGITPNYHVHLDPRPYEPVMLSKPNTRTKYLMASVCPPEFWDILAGFHVELWHLIDDPKTMTWVEWRDSEHIHSAIGGGSTVGQRAMNVAADLGYRKFRVFGMDFSFGTKHWAGPHPGNEEPIIQVEAEGKTFTTTPHLWMAAREMCDFLQTSDVEVEFHGNGMMQQVARSLNIERIS